MRTLLLFLLLNITLQCGSDPLCLECGPSACLYCAYSYPNSSTGTCQTPTKYIPGCYSYTSDGVCGVCQDGYYQNLNPATSTQVCVVLSSQISAFCRFSYLSPTLCSVCMNNVLPSGGSCIPSMSCADPNCDSCGYDINTGNQKCSRCSSGYMLWRGVSPNICIPNNSLTGCVASNSLTSCARCDVGYTWQTGGVCGGASGTRFGGSGLLKVFVSVMVGLIYAL